LLFREVGTHLRGFVDRPLPRRSAARSIGLAVLSFVLLILIFANSLAPDTFDVRVGQLAPKDAKATRELIDRAKTEKLREEKAALVKDIYEQDVAVLPQVLVAIDNAYAAAQVLKADPSLKPEKKISGLMELSDAPEQVCTAMLKTDAATSTALRDASKEIVTRVLNAGVRADNLDPYKKQIDADMENVRYSKDLRTFAAGVTKKCLRPNLVLNQAETFKRRQQARDSVEPVKVLKGQLILRAGEIVTEDHMVLLRDLGIIKAGPPMYTMLASAIYASVLMLGTSTYLWRYDREYLLSESRVLLIVLVFFGTLLFAGVLKRVSGYLMPVAAGTMLYATMIEPRFAMLMAIVLSVSASILAGNDLRFLLVSLAGATAGVFGITHLGQRSDLLKAGVGVSLGSVLMIGALSLTDLASLGETAVMEQHFWGLLNGVVSAVLTIGLLPFFEGVFGIITPMKLIEISNPNQPLLKRLLVEAPGTYHHSVIVGNLAESAAEAVGGDSLLARVGAYYHDVGKTKRPYFFIENQMGIDNPHDRTSPTLSTLIITSHVRDGVEMAKDYRLPERIVDFIREHHGTTLVTYFFSRAAETGKAQEVVEEDFRYEGPRPATKETAIVMLADSVEAAVRSVGKPTPGRIEAMVKKIIKDRLNDHQLDRCDLTMKDLDTIADTFVRVLSGLFHPRVEYPEYRTSVAGTANGHGKALSKEEEDGIGNNGPAAKEG
jgi:hypothetical protein